MAAALAVLAAYAALLPAGKWQGDDYLAAWFVGARGWRILLDRIGGWSPRPLAEILSCLYFAASDALDRPLIAPFLAFLWAGVLGTVALAARAAGLRAPLGLAALWFALALLPARPGEMFYWPMGAVAYLPCWAGLAAATALHLGDARRRGAALAAALAAAALSAEIGALTALLYAVLAAAAATSDRSMRPRLRLLLPALCGAAVCLAVLRGRMQGMGEVMDRASGLAGDWPASIRAAAPAFAREAAGIEGLPLAAGIAVKLAVLAGLPPDARLDPPARRLAAVWAVALLIGAGASVALAFHQFGTLCCGRHAALRQGMVLLALAALGAAFGFAALPAAPRRIGLAVALAALLAVRAAPLAAEWRALPAVAEARWRTWGSGLGPGEAMTLTLAPPGGVTNADSLPPGTYARSTDQPFGDTPWYAWGVMARFGKQRLTIAP
ncbi:MAG: hypothetical protein JSR21_01660 [Proteobacteria bacterium]|nr:hypothetical protein [Pseudomonadota bacterium]